MGVQIIIEIIWALEFSFLANDIHHNEGFSRITYRSVFRGLSMNKRKLILGLLIGVFTLLTVISSHVHAQSSLIGSSDVLIYFRALEDNGQMVYLTSSSRQFYNLPVDKCSLESPDGTYIAESPLPGDTGDLFVRRLDTQAIIIQTPWLTDWDACYINWVNDVTLTIREHDTSQDFFYFDVSNETLSPVSAPTPTVYPSLPGWINTINNVSYG